MSIILKADGVDIGTHTTETQGNQLFNDYKDFGIQPITEDTELGQVTKELTKDEIGQNTRMSSIDMLANLGKYEVSSILALDALIGMGFLPIKGLMITRQKKRLSKSLLNKTSEQIVRIAGGREEQVQRGLGRFFQWGKQNQE